MKKIGIKFLSLILIFVVLFTFFQMYFIKNEVYARSAQYTQYIKSGISAFPESYQKKLAYLKLIIQVLIGKSLFLLKMKTSK